MTLAFIDFLNSREDAAVMWMTAALGYVVYATRGGIVASFGEVLRALVGKLLLVFGGAAAYSAGAVYLADRAGLWHRGALKETLYWFATGGLLMTAWAIERSPRGFAYLREALRRAVAVTILAEFVVNLYVLPLFFELLLFPVFVALAYGQVASDMSAVRRTILNKATVWLGFLLLGYVAIRGLADLDGLLTRETGEGLLVAPVMTVVLLPYLAFVGWAVRREQGRLHRRFREQRERAQLVRGELTVQTGRERAA